jgi:ISXO2 transposase-like protein/transposase-like zinc ribbon protein
MADFPHSLIEFQRRFADERACASYLAAVRWPDGFRCPDCGHDKGWELSCKAFTWECAGCGRQTSVTAGTVLHGSKLPLTVWFWGAWLMATHSNGMSARQLWRQLGLGSYKSAWLLCAKLRRTMVAPDRSPLAGLVEVDETAITYRTKDDPPAGGQGRSHDGKMLVAGAVEIVGNGPGRVRLAAIDDCSAESLHAFIGANVAEGATAKTDGWSGYPGAPGVTHEPHVIGPMAAHLVLPWVHRVFANVKTWALGVYHGLRQQHLQAYLDEFVFRFNRRRSPHAAFRTLLGIAVALKHTTYNMLISPEAQA